MDAIRKREGICSMLGGEMPDVMQMRGSKEPKASDEHLICSSSMHD